MIGVESPGSYGRCLVGALAAAGHEVLHVPAWRTHRERHRQGPGKTDPGDALAIADVVRRKRAELGPALRARAGPRDSDARAPTPPLRPRPHPGDPAAAVRLDAARPGRRSQDRPPRPPARAAHSSSDSSFGDGLAERIAARHIRELARDIEDLNHRIAELDAEIAALLDEHGNPVEDLLGAGNQIAATLIAHAGDVRRFKDAAAFARYCGAAPIPCGSGQTAGRHRLHRGGNRQLNAALYRIAIVQQRHHPEAKAFLARKIREGKTPREARRALKRHLANVVYRRLLAWAETTPAMNRS